MTLKFVAVSEKRGLHSMNRNRLIKALPMTKRFSQSMRQDFVGSKGEYSPLKHLLKQACASALVLRTLIHFD